MKSMGVYELCKLPSGCWVSGLRGLGGCRPCLLLFGLVRT
jgi:hypothetical protein